MKPIKFGCGLLVLIVLFAIAYPSFQKAKLLSSLSKNNIDVSMHDPSTLQSVPWYNPQLGANLRFPAELPAPMLGVNPEERLAFAAARLGVASFEIGIIDLKESFLVEVAHLRDGVRGNPKIQLLGEGFAQIGGLRSYVMDYIISYPAGSVRGRSYMIPGPGKTAYVLLALTPESRWAPFSDIADSAASTFSLGEPPPYAPSGIQAPAAQPPQLSVNPASPLDRATTPPEPQESAPPVPIPAQPPASAPPSNSPHKATTFPSVQVLVGGTWIHGWILKREGEKSFVRYFPRGKSSQTIWATDDQLRPFDAQRMREEAEASWNLQHPNSRLPTAVPGSDAQRPPAHDKSATPPPAPPPAPAPAPATPTEALTIDGAAKLLASTAPADQAKAVDFLATATPDTTHRGRITAALRPLLDADKIIALPAARALALWSDDATERDLIAQFRRAPREKRRPYFEFLAARKTPTAARATAARLRISEDVIAAGAALESMGSVAEPAVRDLVPDTDPAVAKYAIDVLATIGTRDSLPALDKATENSDSKVAAAAATAMQRIQSRIH